MESSRRLSFKYLGFEQLWTNGCFFFKRHFLHSAFFSHKHFLGRFFQRFFKRFFP
jgi:hypothetical protein